MQQFHSSPVSKMILFLAVFCLSSTAYAGDEMGMMKITKAKTAEVAKYIAELKAEDSAVLDITVLVTGLDGNTMKIASTTPGEAGLEAEPEDIDAIMDNKVVAITEGDSLDVTVPIANKEGISAALTGSNISLKNGMTKEMAQTKVKEMAKKIERILLK